MWETVIGLEIHVQLKTDSKIFSGASTQFGAEPNWQACAIDLGMPGILPTLNAKVVEMALQFGLAIQAEIPEKSIFERKNYFYPDLPKGYQISQYEHPIVGRGSLRIVTHNTIKTVGITRAHLEEDAGKSIHDRHPQQTAIDLNRAGTPLLEVVSEPELSSSDEAVAYFKAIHQLVTYLDICDGNLAEGSMRCDANVSIRPKGDPKLGTRTEIKNLNSFRFIKLAIDYEIARHQSLREQGQAIAQETLLFDPNSNTTRPIRSKEDAHDYRYFPDPDLLPLVVNPQQLERIRNQMPELPDAKSLRFAEQYQLPEKDILVLTQQRAMADFFEQSLQAATQVFSDTPARTCANWITSELNGYLNQHQVTIDQCPITPKQLGKLIARIADQSLSGKMAKSLLQHLWTTPQDPDELIKTLGISQLNDTDALNEIIQSVIDTNPQQREQYQKAPEDKRKKMLGFFVGQVMKATKGQANPQQVNQILIQLLHSQ